MSNSTLSPTPETYHGFSQEQRHVLGLIAQVLSPISCLGSLFIVLCYLKFKELRNFAFRLVFFMSICDILGSVAKIMGDAGKIVDGWCYLQAIMLSFFELSSIVWSASIAFTLHMALLWKKPTFSSQTIDHQMPRYHIFIWTFALVMTILPFFDNAYGDAVGWCWIRADKLAWRFIQFYTPLWLVVFYCTYVYASILHRLKNTNEGSSSKLMRRIINYPLVLVVCFGPASVNRMLQAFDTYIFAVSVIHISFSSLFGFANAVVYGLTPVVRDRVRGCLCGGVEHMEVTEDSEDDEYAGNQAAV